MDELSKIAKAYYKASSDHQKKLAREFFNAMDGDGDGEIDRKEFIEFMSNTEFMNNEGHDHTTRLSFFKQLDLDGSGTLDFDEVMRLYYILKSGRPFCDNCKMLIPTTYFKCACIACLKDVGGRSIHLCLDCYTKQKCEHSNNDMSQFLDNYSLVEVMRKSNNLSKAKSLPSETVPGSDNHWNPYVSMVQVWDQRLPPNSNHLRGQYPPAAYPPSWNNHHPPSQCPPIVPHQYPPSWNNHHPPSQCPPIVPHQYPPLGNNHTCNSHASMAQVPFMPPLIVNHASGNQYPSTSQLQASNRPPSIPQGYQHNYLYHQPPIATSTAIVPKRENWQEALEAFNAALSIGAIASVLCSIL